mmetsp:Transcript_49201/g.73153  ORF Transcript_49201/g.73153 Transcript_49201/m.73153 type:complete len:919 (-) Transcript_49201:155-2911(-)|eukprot:CAMPEP_0195524536 /NCGR_PEP_ID=MMETSP0794_2-20130614/24426_1 /TAXON_ID=515487 /ORGANISM="Stephanopyxis turris, Strain CCMP 815" /LENGTH=918 /DNA_ID=CAMNT_0040654779 /DNA_START=215 /DNA_END=2971 /DNA_ORIENTATION=-
MATQVRPVNKKKVSSTPGIELAELRASGQTKNPRSAHLQLNSGDDDAGGGDSEPLLQKNEVSAAVEKNRREAKQGGHPETKHGGHAESKHGGAAETKRGTKQPTASGAKASTSGDVLLDVNAAIPEPNYADDISASALMEQLAALRDKDKDILSNFVDEFRAEAPEQEIIVGSVDVEDIALQERAYEEARVKELEGLARKHQQREIDLLHRERVARATVETERQQLRARHREREKELVQQTKVNRQRLKTYFRQAEDKLKRAIKSEQGAVHELFGDLESGERTTLRRWRASWNHKPIPLQIDIERITAVKDKIPAGVYVVLVSLFDRMGGKPLKWSKADAGLYEKLKPSTQPLVHKGRFYDIDMKINQSVFVVSPSETKVEPSMCFVFELFRLADKKIPVDRCVGWTVMPMVDAHMNITHGKFKLPILCGPVNRKIDRYGAFTEWYSDDINRWLANIYFSIQHLPREVIKRGKAMKEYDVELALSGQLLGLHTLPTTDEKGDSLEFHSPEQVYESVDISAKVRDAQLKHLVKKSESNSDAGADTNGGNDVDLHDYRMAMQDDRGRHDAGQLKLRFMWWAIFSDFGMSQVKKPHFWLGLFLLLAAFLLRVYAHYLGGYVALSFLDVPVYTFTISPFTVLLKYAYEEISMNTQAIYVMAGPGMNLAIFIVFMILEFIANMCLGFGAGELSHFFCFFGIFAVLDPVLVLIVDLIVGNFNCASQPICAVDLSADGCFCIEGDAFKLGELTMMRTNSAIVGILLTVAIYVLVATLTGVLLYIYFMYVYLNGRIRDLYWRVHGTERTFFIPEDLEVSLEELEWIIVKADKWRNPTGATRKAYVCDYELTDPLDPLFKVVTSHLAIYTVEVGGAKKLYRHFLKKPDGCIMEVFGDVSMQLQKEQTAIERLLLDQGGGGGYSGGPL